MAYTITFDHKGKGGRPVGWRNKIAALRHVPRLIKLFWQTHRLYTVAVVVLRLLRAFVPVATLWVGKLIIDIVVAARDQPADFPRLWKLVALEAGIVFGGQVVVRISSLLESLLGDLFSNHISVRLMEHAATLDLQHFENP